MKFAFSSKGWHNASFDEMCKIAKELKYDGISRIIVSTVDKTQTYTKSEDISRITGFLKETETEETDDVPSPDSTNYIVAVVYEDGSVSYAYLNDGGFFKLHGEDWKRVLLLGFTKGRTQYK